MRSKKKETEIQYIEIGIGLQYGRTSTIIKIWPKEDKVVVIDPMTGGPDIVMGPIKVEDLIGILERIGDRNEFHETS